ncbi:membrane protein insertase YidC [Corynebacterium sp. H128]|uniref:membrane protein insertase YidC n=1 Tax=unclassified Corynebacterium TaxID=2624378 RepID=UPI00309676C5
MLNFVYWLISFVLWFWHKLFSIPFGAGSGISWILAIVFLTFSIRILLLKPMINQMRSGRKMQEFQPLMQEIREKYKNDQQKMMEETRKLQKEMGVNPIAGCLPILVQMPVFIGLFHVLRSFNRTGTGAGQLGMSIEANRNTANYYFKPEDVQSFLDAKLFGVPLSSYIWMPSEQYAAFPGADLSKLKIAVVAAPLILITVLATHFNARLSLDRQKARLASGKQQAPSNEMMASQMAMMNKMMLWFMPATLLFTGVLWHIGLLFYMVANNIWTFFQTKLVYDKMDKEEEAEIEAKKAAKRATAPKPGQRPDNPKKKKK